MTTLFVASNGGHLAQLFSLAPRMNGLGEDRLWVSYDTEQARTLLARERKVYIPYIGERDIVGVLRSTWSARSIMSAERTVSAVVSTGSAIALSFLPYAASTGIEAHYVESAARVGAPSLTGRVLQYIPGIRLYRQYPHVAKGRWVYGGSVFDGFEGVNVAPRPVKRVVVTVGTDKGFGRLISAAASILPHDVDVLWQTGHTDVARLGIDARRFVPEQELKQAMRECDAVIAHAGCGSVLMALAAGKNPILVPRDPAHGEVVDRHQIEIAEWMSQRGLAVKREPDELRFNDLEAVAACAVHHCDPPPFELTRRP
jgi:UDP-N-acetylglucosamine--N-acetylmuramyl-(pentapeptide) pyrophosphoryl-undecaprenol N-acetylglucosamine transferase